MTFGEVGLRVSQFQNNLQFQTLLLSLSKLQFVSVHFFIARILISFPVRIFLICYLGRLFPESLLHLGADGGRGLATGSGVKAGSQYDATLTQRDAT